MVWYHNEEKKLDLIIWKENFLSSDIKERKTIAL